MHEYVFKSEKTDKIPGGSSLICHFSDDPVLVYGKLKSLFGEPLYETENYEDQFLYCISSQDEAGKEICIYAYSGGSGPAVGGLQDESSIKAADKLVEFVQKALPADYDYTGYYMDGCCKISQGIKNGVPYYEEEVMELSDEEFNELYKKVYGL